MRLLPWKRTHDDTAERAVSAAQEHLEEARAIRPEVSRVAESLRSLRETNHFAASIDAVYRAVRGDS